MTAKGSGANVSDGGGRAGQAHVLPQIAEALAGGGEQQAHATAQRLARCDLARAVHRRRALLLHDLHRRLHAPDHDRHWRERALAVGEDGSVYLRLRLEEAVRAERSGELEGRGVMTCGTYKASGMETPQSQWPLGPGGRGTPLLPLFAMRCLT